MSLQRSAILFDLDGTLVDSAASIAQALSIIRARRGASELTPAHVRPWISLGADELVSRALGATAADREGDLSEFRLVLSQTRVSGDCIYDGVVSALGDLKSAGLSLGLVTNKPERLSRKLLTVLGLSEFFGAIVGGDTTSSPKPDPLPVFTALTLLEVHPWRAALVGDSMIDAGAAEAAGLPFYLFEGGYGASDCAHRKAQFTFNNYALLTQMILSRAENSQNAS